MPSAETYEDRLGVIPSWAIRSTRGELVPGAQLPTKDGRRTGNAHIIEIGTSKWIPATTLYTVLTDAGNVMHLSTSEVDELFYPPMWIADVAEVTKKFGR